MLLLLVFDIIISFGSIEQLRAPAYTYVLPPAVKTFDLTDSEISRWLDPKSKDLTDSELLDWKVLCYPFVYFR